LRTFLSVVFAAVMLLVTPPQDATAGWQESIHGVPTYSGGSQAATTQSRRRATRSRARRARAARRRAASRRSARARSARQRSRARRAARASRRATRSRSSRRTQRQSSGRFIRSTQRVSVSAYIGRVRARAPGTVLTGMASYYWQPQPVASGGRFNPNALTAAHKTLPFGTRVRVTNLNNGRSVVVTINDRGPYIRGRIIDLSRRAATVVGMRQSGVAPVRVVVLGRS